MSGLILRKDKFPKGIGGGLENDLILHEPTIGDNRRWSVALANKRRLKKEESEAFRLKLEALTGLKWERDSISKFVFHHKEPEPETNRKESFIMPKEKYPKIATKARVKSISTEFKGVKVKFDSLMFSDGQYGQLHQWLVDKDELMVTIEQNQAKMNMGDKTKSPEIPFEEDPKK